MCILQVFFRRYRTSSKRIPLKSSFIQASKQSDSLWRFCLVKCHLINFLKLFALSLLHHFFVFPSATGRGWVMKKGQSVTGDGVQILCRNAYFFVLTLCDIYISLFPQRAWYIFSTSIDWLQGDIIWYVNHYFLYFLFSNSKTIKQNSVWEIKTKKPVSEWNIWNIVNIWKVV